jgi:hypothetical protein
MYPGMYTLSGQDGAVAEDLHRSWKRTRTQLDRARRALTNPNDQALKEYESYLDANELGLALDELVQIAEQQRAPGEVWNALAAAGHEMNLGEDDEFLGRSVQLIRKHL